MISLHTPDVEARLILITLQSVADLSGDESRAGENSNTTHGDPETHGSEKRERTRTLRARKSHFNEDRSRLGWSQPSENVETYAGMLSLSRRNPDSRQGFSRRPFTMTRELLWCPFEGVRSTPVSPNW